MLLVCSATLLFAGAAADDFESKIRVIRRMELLHRGSSDGDDDGSSAAASIVQEEEALQREMRAAPTPQSTRWTNTPTTFPTAIPSSLPTPVDWLPPPRIKECTAELVQICPDIHSRYKAYCLRCVKRHQMHAFGWRMPKLTAPTQKPTAIPHTAVDVFQLLRKMDQKTERQEAQLTACKVQELAWVCEHRVEVAPTSIPTPVPATSAPTAAPSPASSPAFLATMFDDITATPSPSSSPTTRPTHFLTFGPTQFPTSAPSSDPTAAPTQFPTRAPTAVPTAVPTSHPTFACVDVLRRLCGSEHEALAEALKNAHVTTVDQANIDAANDDSGVGRQQLQCLICAHSRFHVQDEGSACNSISDYQGAIPPFCGQTGWRP